MQITAHKGIDIDLNGDTGLFTADIDGEHYHAPSRQELIAQIDKALTRNGEATPIPITLVDVVQSRYSHHADPYQTGRGIAHIQFRRQHAHRYNTYLCLSDDGSKKFNIDGVTGQMCHRLTDAEIGEYLNLTTAVDQAAAVYKAWLARVKFIAPTDRGRR